MIAGLLDITRVSTLHIVIIVKNYRVLYELLTLIFFLISAKVLINLKLDAFELLSCLHLLTLLVVICW